MVRTYLYFFCFVLASHGGSAFPKYIPRNIALGAEQVYVFRGRTTPRDVRRPGPAREPIHPEGYVPLLEFSKDLILDQSGQNATEGHKDEMKKEAEAQAGHITVRETTAFSTLNKRQGPVQCGPGQPCLDGSCCNKDGKCGFKAANCGADVCISNCDAKAMCGIDSANQNSCALNLCCSYYGWCGTESVHCYDPEPEFGVTPCQQGFGLCEIVPPPECGEDSGTATQRKIAYYQSWNSRDRQCHRVYPKDINTRGLTHLNFAFLFFDPQTFEVKPMDDRDILLYPEFTSLKKAGLETWIAIGGWSMNDPGPTQYAFSDMAGCPVCRKTFIRSLIEFMERYGFQGADIDWEYPSDPKRGGNPDDKQNLVTLLREMRATFGTRFGLSCVLAPDYWYLQGFDPKAMEPYVDWMGFMAYDLHGAWDANVPALGAKIRPHTDIREIDKGLTPLWFAGVNPAKVVLGLAYYGRGFTISDPNCPIMGCGFSGPNSPGPCTNSAGVLSNREIRELIQRKNLQGELVDGAMIKELTWEDQWIGYDDVETFALKTRFANKRCLGGTMIWSIDFDAETGGSGNSTTAPPIQISGSGGEQPTPTPPPPSPAPESTPEPPPEGTQDNPQPAPEETSESPPPPPPEGTPDTPPSDSAISKRLWKWPTIFADLL